MRLNSGHLRENLVGSAVRRTLLAAAFAAGGALPVAAFAQEAPAPKDQAMEEVVVTGSILRRTDAETPSPVTVLSAETLEERGINTVSEAIQRLSANNAGTIQQGWNTGFNFASGANAPALRGLTVQATLSVADGLRIAPYPLADDGQRNFVDLNTIPSAIVERIEVLRDGASSTYGADAIAGVVNVITKKEIQGLHIGGSTAMSQEGGGDENRFDMTWGYGDLESQGFNFYVSGEYQKQDVLWARDRDYPFNSQDLTGICGSAGSCMHNLNWNGVTAEDDTFNGLISIPGVALARHVITGANTGAGDYAYLNPGAGCREFDTITLTPDIVGDDRFLLVDNLEIQIHTFNDKPIGLVFPPHVEITVASCEAGARGDTASGSVTKIAKLETGMEIRVPLFVKEGDKIKVHTESREFSGRA